MAYICQAPIFSVMNRRRLQTSEQEAPSDTLLLGYRELIAVDEQKRTHDQQGNTTVAPDEMLALRYRERELRPEARSWDHSRSLSSSCYSLLLITPQGAEKAKVHAFI